MKKDKGLFGVKIDSTDHFWFICNECKVTAEITDTPITKENRKKINCIRFHLKCNKCGRIGQRKISPYDLPKGKASW